ncbi:G-type lectin S-receptor-like serine/threonine-protein kinase SD1-1 [Ranunculus cassubicifolius]
MVFLFIIYCFVKPCSGYMSPEYAVDGRYSVKSDVFSFGVLVLEIISGNENLGFSHPDHGLNLLGHAWRLWSEDNIMELVDESMNYSKEHFCWRGFSFKRERVV